MKLSQKAKTSIFQVSALLILFAAILYEFNSNIAKYAMIIGALGYIVSTFINRYKGENLRGKRLFNIQLLASVAMAVSAYLMFVNINGWVVTLLIAAILTLYFTWAYSLIEKEDKDI